MSNEKKDFAKWWILVFVLMLISIVILTTFRYFGKFTSTVVERKVFEQSYQKQAGDKQRLSTYQAQLSAINSRLNGALDDNTRQELLSQKAMLEIQIRSAR